LVHLAPVAQAGIAPDNYHATTIFPEYFQIKKGTWVLPVKSRMDGVVVLGPNGSLEVKEFRELQVGERVVVGRGENGEEGIYIHADGFARAQATREKFAFRTGLSRETAFSIDYDELYELLSYDREHGFILWVLGPAAVFDRDARQALVTLIDQGYVQGLLAGNALATHDLEAALFQTALGQEIYGKRPVPLGHYKHLDAINAISRAGSIAKTMETGLIDNGVMHALWRRQIPMVLAGSIRDDGPLPEVLTDALEAQRAMRALAGQATTVIALATQLHSIATGNLIPLYHVRPDGVVRPVYFYVVDMSEFAVAKLANRGSLAARGILTNAQDFLVILERGLQGWCRGG
jgi:lysine-ketoglutarate reductase/saccharopine dehydrogenase-like protein (TIGR00300 family)